MSGLPPVSVKVTNSEFNHNLLDVDDGWGDYDSSWSFDGWYDEDYNYYQEADETGLVIWPWMASTTLNGVEVSDNRGSGASISGWTNTVTVTNSVFTNNDYTGLFVGGNIVTLQNILASNNGGDGIYSYVNTSLNGTNLFLENNGSHGVFVDACQDWDDNGVCNSTGAGTVTLKTGSSTGNGGSGFAIISKGAITITDTYLAGNGESGYYLDNSMATAPATITLTNTNSYDNGFHGFDLKTRGAVTMTNFNANDNFAEGVFIFNELDSRCGHPDQSWYSI